MLGDLSADPGPAVVGLLLAAGAGTRMGGPKALLRDPAGASLAARTVEVLLRGGCRRVLVVLGAAADQVAATLPGEPRLGTVRAAHWATGQGASLRAGLSALAASQDDVAAAVMLVDLPGVGPPVITRVLAGATSTSLARAGYGGRPGHPVLLGRGHWDPILAGLDPTLGARDYLRRQPVDVIECGDLADGSDVDVPADANAHGLGWTPGNVGSSAVTDGG